MRRRTFWWLWLIVVSLLLYLNVHNAQAKPLAKDCRFQYSDSRAGWTPQESMRTFNCWVRRYGSPDPVYAWHIAERESRWQHRATSSTGCKGIYQWSSATWEGARASFPKLASVTSSDAYNARSNIAIAVKFQRRFGFGPWS